MPGEVLNSVNDIRKARKNILTLLDLRSLGGDELLLISKTKSTNELTYKTIIELQM